MDVELKNILRNLLLIELGSAKRWCKFSAFVFTFQPFVLLPDSKRRLELHCAVLKCNEALLMMLSLL